MIPAADEEQNPSSRAAAAPDSDAHCIWCDLPIPARTTSAAQYCCYGCRLAHTLAEEKGDEGQLRWTVIRLGLAIFFTMNLMAFTMTMWSLDVYDVEPDPFQRSLYEVFRWLSMTLAIPVLLLLGMPMLMSAFSGQKTNTFFADALIVLGVVAAGITSALNVIRGTGPVYFEVGAMVLVMVTLGRWLEAEGKQKATSALDQFSALLPETVHRVTEATQSTDEDDSVPANSVVVGDLIRVRSGERFPFDGLIVNGEAAIDEQIFTGESTAVFRREGDAVLAGTLNLDGLLVLRATAPFQGGSFGRLLELLRKARTEQGHYQRIAERIATWFLPAVILVSVATFAFHWQRNPSDAIQNSLSVLLIACPCALGLATPLAIWTSFSVAVKHQVLFRNGEAVEQLAGIQHLGIDKTGTLTTGDPTVAGFESADRIDEAETLQLCHALADTSNHPLSKAISRFRRTPDDDQVPCPPALPHPDDRVTSTVQQCRNVPGNGVEATLSDGRILRLGRLEFVSHQPVATSEFSNAEAPQQSSLVGLGIDGQLAAIFRIDETLRPEAAQMLNDLNQLDISTTILTGDRTERAEQLLQELNRQFSDSGFRMSPPDLRSQLSPEDKVRSLHELRARYESVAMLGDGINDAPVLAAADVGIALGCGSDVARDSADVCLLSSDLSRVPWAIKLAQRTRRAIRQNLGWAFAYNTIGILLASAGWLNPAVAAALMIGSSLLVITNSLRLLHQDKEHVPEDDGKGALAQPQQMRDNTSHPFRRDAANIGAGDAELPMNEQDHGSLVPTSEVGARNADDRSGDHS